MDHGQFQILVTLFLVNQWTGRHLMIPDIQHRRRYLALVLVVPHLDPMHAPIHQLHLVKIDVDFDTKIDSATPNGLREISEHKIRVRRSEC